MTSKKVTSELPNFQKPILKVQLILDIYYLVEFKEEFVKS